MWKGSEGSALPGRSGRTSPPGMGRTPSLGVRPLCLVTSVCQGRTWVVGPDPFARPSCLVPGSTAPLPFAR